MTKPTCKHCNSNIEIVRDMHLWWAECNYCNRTYQVSETEYTSDHDRKHNYISNKVQEVSSHSN